MKKESEIEAQFRKDVRKLMDQYPESKFQNREAPEFSLMDCMIFNSRSYRSVAARYVASMVIHYNEMIGKFNRAFPTRKQIFELWEAHGSYPENDDPEIRVHISKYAQEYISITEEILDFIRERMEAITGIDMSGFGEDPSIGDYNLFNPGHGLWSIKYESGESVFVYSFKHGSWVVEADQSDFTDGPEAKALLFGFRELDPMGIGPKSWRS